MACIRIRMITSSDQSSILAFLPVQSTTNRQIAAQDPTTVRALASQACTVSLQRKSVQTPTAMVRCLILSQLPFLIRLFLTPLLYDRYLIHGTAYDDQTSTFILPSGGGFEVVFCPKGRSSNILKVLGDQLRAVAASGGVSEQIIQELANGTYPRQSIATRPSLDGCLALILVFMAGVVLFFPP